MDEKIETAIALLEEEAAKSDKPPAMVVMAPDMGESILGNRAGFLRLAIAAVRASQGESQNLDSQPWVCHEDADWQIKGLSFDEYAHMHLPEKLTPWKERRQKILGILVVAFVAGCLAIGFGTILHWIFGRSR
ncbi:hypothetical protein [Tunturibacter empetritectus]|uniref:Transmembrane protein n=1 Tax=Tunturiibacter lichenicola TaxID=2051959 RepID=A0A7W8J977_9BACT|nr:hypothetical protein [Edaphobacter lichenicola]MBB5343634.1 hypothetical protein [Edaphobacter lichenicola]